MIMSYELLATAIIGQAVRDIEDYLIFKDEEGKEALNWAKRNNNWFNTYAHATCGPKRMKLLVNSRIREIKNFISWLEDQEIKPEQQNRRWIREQWEKVLLGSKKLGRWQVKLTR